MIALTDVHYGTKHATAALVLAADWGDDSATLERTATIPIADTYQPGAFYRRELPALLAVLAEVDASLTAVIVDGYVWLGPDRPGLGAHLWEALGRKVPVVGIAKNAFAGAQAIEVLRGSSKRPLHVTAAGLEPSIAAELVRSMHGAQRIPT